MIYSRASSQASSSGLVDSPYHSPAAAALLSYPYTHPLDSYNTEYPQPTPHFHDLMSTASYDFNDPSLGLDFDSAPHDSTAFHGNSQQLFNLSNGAFQSAWPQPGHNPFQHQQHFAQSYNNHHLNVPQQTHRRATSNASSYGAPDSPYSRASSVQYPTAYPQGQQYMQHQQPAMWDNGYSSPNTGIQHLPTPSHTPKSDSQMDVKPVPKNASLARTESANKSLRRAHRQTSNAQDGPLTPRTVNGDYDDAHNGAFTGELDQDFEKSSSFECLFGSYEASRHIPKFDRTISDICQDELYNPNTLTAGPTPAQQAHFQQQMYTPHNNLIYQRLNDAHMGRAAHMQDTRQASPFRAGSREAYSQQSQSQPESQQEQRAKANYIAFQQQLQRHAQQAKPEPQPQTISPKDAFPKENVSDDDNMPSLFPTSSSQDMAPSTMYAPHNATGQASQHARTSMPSGNGHYGFATSGMPSSQEAQMPEFPAHLASMETTKSESVDEDDDDDDDSLDIDAERPVDTTSGSGTYTCTYHGCSERFKSPTMLQKHKREAHRSTGAGGAAAVSTMSSAQQQMTQAGPHKCSRINPSTGKPCNVVFSRPYDLTRHEDTIHAERKKVRCPHCTEEKTFSRADALTRHLRVVHPHVSFPGKHRRRAA